MDQSTIIAIIGFLICGIVLTLFVSAFACRSKSKDPEGMSKYEANLLRKLGHHVPDDMIRADQRSVLTQTDEYVVEHADPLAILYTEHEPQRREYGPV